MSDKKFFKITVTLSRGDKTSLYLGLSNFALSQNSLGQVSIVDNSQRNGTWQLAQEETFELVSARIDEAMQKAGLL